MTAAHLFAFKVFDTNTFKHLSETYAVLCIIHCHSCLVADLSLKDFPTPNLTEFLNLEIPKTNTKQSNIPRIADITLPRNQWYFHYEEQPAGPPNPAGSAKGQHMKIKGSDIISWSSLICILVVIDLVWFVHRMARSYATAKMILYGCPSFIDYKKSNIIGTGSNSAGHLYIAVKFHWCY